MSFHKANTDKKTNNLIGVKSWINGSQLISFGHKDFDNIQGGGIPLGSILLILKDNYSNYSNILTKYFISEGISSKQNILLCSDDNINIMKKNMENLPENVTILNQSKDLPVEKDKIDNTLQIAWQYKKYLNKTINQSQFCNTYNLSHKIQEDLLLSASIDYYKYNNKNTLGDLVNKLEESLKDETKVTRIILDNLDIKMIDNQFDLISFVINLHSIINKKPTVILLEITSDILTDQVLNSIENQCDGVFHLESFGCIIINIISF